MLFLRAIFDGGSNIQNLCLHIQSRGILSDIQSPRSRILTPLPPHPSPSRGISPPLPAAFLSQIFLSFTLINCFPCPRRFFVTNHHIQFVWSESLFPIQSGECWSGLTLPGCIPLSNINGGGFSSQDLLLLSWVTCTSPPNRVTPMPNLHFWPRVDPAMVQLHSSLKHQWRRRLPLTN